MNITDGINSRSGVEYPAPRVDPCSAVRSSENKAERDCWDKILTYCILKNGLLLKRIINILPYNSEH
jgi:hypothetical protein